MNKDVYILLFLVADNVGWWYSRGACTWSLLPYNIHRKMSKKFILKLL